MGKLLTVDDVAAILQISRRTAYKLMHKMPHLEHPFRVTETALMAYIAANTVYPGNGYTETKTRLRAVETPKNTNFKIARRRA